VNRYQVLMIVIFTMACAAMEKELLRLGGETLGGEPDIILEHAPEKGKEVSLWGTHYYSHVAKIDPNGYPLYDKSGKAISPKISKADYCACGIEGTCSINSQIYDYSGVGVQRVPFTCKYAGHKIYWSKGKFKYGKGNRGNALEPFVSVAADQSRFPFGTKIYVPAAKGLKLPGGKRHDGFFVVADVGSAIKGNHLDFFTGPFYGEFKFPFVKSKSSATFKAFVQ
jgi:3D (Asp-Asp-Asp) domain-containing protein